MKADFVAGGAGPAFTKDLAEAVADDAEALAVLHDRELTAEMFSVLRACDFPLAMGLLPRSREEQDIRQLMAQVLAAAPDPLTRDDLDDLAAEYAAIYLNGTYKASPYESVWTDEDHCMCQQSMFDLRKIYAEAGYAISNWRERPDDHLVFQLAYIAKMARQATELDDWRKLADFMDNHLLRWLADFADCVARRSGRDFYVGLALLTAAWGANLREQLAQMLGQPRPVQKIATAQ